MYSESITESQANTYPLVYFYTNLHNQVEIELSQQSMISGDTSGALLVSMHELIRLLVFL